MSFWARLNRDCIQRLLLQALQLKTAGDMALQLSILSQLLF